MLGESLFTLDPAVGEHPEGGARPQLLAGGCPNCGVGNLRAHELRRDWARCDNCHALWRAPEGYDLRLG